MTTGTTTTDAPPARRRGPLWAKLLLAALPLAVAFLAAEVWLRRSVPFCGTTPFRTSSVEGVSHELRPSFATHYKGVDVATNAAGFRGAEFGAKRDGRGRIAIVGDSVAFGNAVVLEDTLAARLQRVLDAEGAGAEVLNCGVPGYDVDDVARSLEARVLPLAPDVVVYLFVFNDVEVNEMSGAIPEGAVIDTLSEYPLRSATLQWLGLRGRAVARSVLGRGDGGWVSYIHRAFEEGGRERLREGIGRIRDACAKSGTRLLVACYPHLLPLAGHPFRKIDDAAKAICAEQGVRFVDLAAAFGPDEDLTRLWASPFDSHPDGAANARVAEVLAEALRGK